MTAAVHGLWYFRATSMRHRRLTESVIPAGLNAVRLTVLAARLVSGLPGLSGVSSISDSVQRRRVQRLTVLQKTVAVYVRFGG